MASSDLPGPAPLRAAEPVRQKSGLVRSASGFDAFVFALGGISVGIMFEWGNYFGTGFYPGANIVLALVISTLAAIVIAWGYQYWGQIFPRTGGDYVFLSRGLHPGFALGTNFVYCWILMVSPAFSMSIKQPLLSSLSATLGEATGWNFLDRFSSWLNTNNGYALIGTVDLLVATAIAFFGLKAALGYMKVLFLTGFLGQLVLIVALAFSSTSTFERHLRDATGHTVAQIEQAATKSGFAFGGFDFHNTLNLTNWYVTAMFFAALVLYIGGEIKNVARNVRYALVAAVAFCGLGTFLYILALDHVIPRRVQGALAWNSFSAPDFSTASVPYPHELMRILWGAHGGGLVLTLIAYVSLLFWVLIWTPVVISFTQRGVLAWALDGLTPRWVGMVDERRHSPVPALIIAFVMGESFMLSFAYHPSFRTIILLVPLFIGIAITMAVGTIFPFTRREFVEQSVVADARIGRIHKMTITCGAATVIALFWSWLLWSDSIASGTDRTPIVVTAVIAVAIGLYYFALWAYKRRQGEDISVTFKRIPIE